MAVVGPRRRRIVSPGRVLVSALFSSLADETKMPCDAAHGPLPAVTPLAAEWDVAGELLSCAVAPRLLCEAQPVRTRTRSARAAGTVPVRRDIMAGRPPGVAG